MRGSCASCPCPCPFRSPAALQTGEVRRPNRRLHQEYFSGNHVCFSWFFLFKTWRTQQSATTQWRIGSKKDPQPSNRREVAAVAIPLRKGEEETQMRRMEKDAARAGGGAGGPLSKPNTAVKSGARDSAVVLRTTVLLRTTVT